MLEVVHTVTPSKNTSRLMLQEYLVAMKRVKNNLSLAV